LADPDETLASPRIGIQSTLVGLSDTLAVAETQVERPSDGPEERPDQAGAPEDRYRPVGRLGAGGMGCVDKVWDGDLLRDLAAKQLLPELSDHPALTKQFLWEARVTASLDHPHVIPVHDLGLTAEGRPFFTMKFVDGQSLGDLLERLEAKGEAGEGDGEEPFPLTRRLRVFHKVCEAVAFAHARGVLHRDLKPDNVMLGDHGEVLVMDWGLARPLAGPGAEHLAELQPEGALEGQTLGTPLYMSPEQAEGRNDELDARSDVFSLGAMLYELTALQAPYEAESVSAILEAVRTGAVIPLSQAAPDVPPPIRAVVAQAMALDPAARYATAADLAADVERLLDDRVPKAMDTTFLQRVAHFYTHTDRGMASVRVMDVDLMSGGCFVCGMGAGALLVRWVADWAWPCVVVGLLLCIPFFRRWVRRGRDAS